MQSTWKTRTMDLLWETKREYVKEWHRNTLIATTSGDTLEVALSAKHNTKNNL